MSLSSLWSSNQCVAYVCIKSEIKEKVKTMKITIFHLFGRDGGNGNGSDSGCNAKSAPNASTLSTLHEKPITKPAIAWRELISFWIFGLCTEFGYVVMICAAYDILSRFDNVRFYTYVFDCDTHSMRSGFQRCYFRLEFRFVFEYFGFFF